MERLKLTCGRYLPTGAGGAEERLAALEAYLGRLSAELEYRLGEAGLVLETVAGGTAIGSAEAASSAADSIETGEEVIYE